MPDVALRAEVAPLSDAIAGTLTYVIPAALQDKVVPGVAVIIPLRNRMVAGIVIVLNNPADASSAPSEMVLKPIHSVIDDKPALNEEQLRLARWMSGEYCAHLGRCCALMIPPGYTPSSAYLYSLARELSATDATDPRDARARIIALLQARGAVVESKLKTHLRGTKDWRQALRRLVEDGVVVRTSTLEPAAVKPHRTTMAQLVISDATLEIVIANLLSESAKAPRRAAAIKRRLAVLEYLQQNHRLAWAEWIFAETGANKTDLEWLAQSDYVLLGDAERWRDPLADIDYIVTSPPPLTSDQERAWATVQQSMGDGSVNEGDAAAPVRRPASRPQFLLRGVTGS
ncbi:MAG TPA: hypothetical protein VGK87_03365, partial [Anaerolineae bacterium]